MQARSHGRTLLNVVSWAALVCLVTATGAFDPVAASDRDGQASMFAESAAYEQFMGRWSRQLAPRYIAFADVRERQDVLDVGSGTGALAVAITTAIPSARVLGIDPSKQYVEYAASRVRDGNPRFAVGDAQQLELADASFDRVMSLLVMNFIPDRDKALREMIRVTRPGGIVSAVVWDYADGMQMLRVFWDEAVAANPASAARDERHMPLCKQGELAAMWRAHNLTGVIEEPLTIAQTFASFDDYWTPFLGGQGPAGAYVVKLADADREALRQRVRRRLLGDGPDRPITLQARAWAVKGVAGKR